MGKRTSARLEKVSHQCGLVGCRAAQSSWGAPSKRWPLPSPLRSTMSLENMILKKIKIVPLMVLVSLCLAGSNLLCIKIPCVCETEGALRESVPGSPVSCVRVPPWESLPELTLPLPLGMLKLSPLGGWLRAGEQLIAVSFCRAVPSPPPSPRPGGSFWLNN